MKLSESWLFSYNCVGLFELKAPSLHSTRWEGKHVKSDKLVHGNPSCTCTVQCASLLQVQKARPVGTDCSLFTFELRDLLRIHSPGHIFLQRGFFLKYFSSSAVAQILVVLSHSYSLCLQHHSPPLLSSGLDFSYFKSDTSCIFVLFVTTN